MHILTGACTIALGIVLGLGAWTHPGLVLAIGISVAVMLVTVYAGVALVCAVAAEIRRNNAAAARGRQARLEAQQQWEQEMLAKREEQRVAAIRQQFLRDCFPGR